MAELACVRESTSVAWACKMESPLRAETLPTACAFLQDCALTQPLRGSLFSGLPRPSVVGCPSLSEKGQQGAPNPHVSAGRGRLGERQGLRLTFLPSLCWPRHAEQEPRSGIATVKPSSGMPAVPPGSLKTL
nr:protein cornichon homolog 3 isoform X6 [Pongo abelii]